MEQEDVSFASPLNPNNFPAKLWRLVNSPACCSVRWDRHGQGVIIDQQMFQHQHLSPFKASGSRAGLFKTTNFTSFIRQLNLYGFRKTVPWHGKLEGGDHAVTEAVRHHFHNPYFKRGQPELLVKIKRLTSTNKAKLEAGLEVSCRPPSRLWRRLAIPLEHKRGATHMGLLAGNPQQNTVSPCQFVGMNYIPESRNELLVTNSFDRPTTPHRSWTMGLGDSDSSATFLTEKAIPVSVIQRVPCTTFDSSSTLQPGLSTVHVNQGHQSMAAAGLKYNNLMPHYTQFPPGFYTGAIYQCCSQGTLHGGITGSVHQPPSLSHYNYYQPNYPVSFVDPDSEEWLNNENDINRNDVNLDSVFQLADELQASSKLCMLEMETPEKLTQST